MDNATVESVTRAIEEIREIRESTAGQPWSEADTETRAIEPILKALGYSFLDFKKRRQESAGYYPDYTMLPENPRCWYLEAKAWGENIEAKADQAVNYANNNGADYAVITNGERWLLFEVHAKVVTLDKVMLRVGSIFEPSAAEKLSNLSKLSMLENLPLRIAEEAKVRKFLASQIADPGSKLLRGLRERIKSELNVAVACEQLASMITLREAAPESAAPSDEVFTASPAMQQSDPAHTPAPPTHGDRLGLAQLTRIKPVHWPAPRAVYLPDGNTETCETWKRAYAQAVTWILINGNVAVPFKSHQSNQKEYMLNVQPCDQTGKRMEEPIELAGPNGAVYLEGCVSARGSVRRATALATAAGVDPDAIRYGW
jgi:predicted type IV restriction endonuclease